MVVASRQLQQAALAHTALTCEAIQADVRPPSQYPRPAHAFTDLLHLTSSLPACYPSPAPYMAAAFKP